MALIWVIEDKCTGCGLCVKKCPFGAIEIVEKVAVIDESKCTLCKACVEACRSEAIALSPEAEAMQEKPSVDLNAYRGVWIFAEQRNGRLSSVAYELLGVGRTLSDDLDVALTAVLFGSGMEEAAGALVARGADRVLWVDEPELRTFHDDSYAQVFEELIREEKPEIVLAGATAVGRSFIPKVAAKLETGLTADCTELAIDREKRLLVQTRPAFGGNIMATILCPNRRPQMATVRHKVMQEAEAQEGRKGEIVRRKAKPESLLSRTSLIEFIEELEETINIVDADVIVSGGRGLGKPENFALIRELALVLEGAVGASRAAVDEGWIPYSHQVGQTGKTVSPKLYIACGISGAIQHLVGMRSSDVIVAINKDPEAPIFDVATFGIVGDLFEVVPALVRKLKG
ncbi:MAG: electron transfer flavoprotein subunit alpha [Candidatus Latescibacterota bacterium]|nr:MAG: electron transfer flavoprotein subunit alpha [Candidatus Latescibacterota bacterium]